MYGYLSDFIYSLNSDILSISDGITIPQKSKSLLSLIKNEDNSNNENHPSG